MKLAYFATSCKEIFGDHIRGVQKQLTNGVSERPRRSRTKLCRCVGTSKRRERGLVRLGEGEEERLVEVSREYNVVSHFDF